MGTVQTISVGSVVVTLSELSVGGDERLLCVSFSGAKHELRFLAYYEPSLTVVEDLLVVWAGSKLYCLNTSINRVCSRTVDTDIVAVIPDGRRLIVISELAVEIIGADCAISEVLFAHDEIIIEAKLEISQLVLRDLQGRVFEVEVPAE